MNSTKTTSAEEIQLVSRFEGLRRTLLAGQYAASLEKPLAFWALPSDRRLPLALLGRALNELLNTPFRELAATPGIGQKKLHCLVMLLARVVAGDPIELGDDLGAPSPGNPHRPALLTPAGSIPRTCPSWCGLNGGRPSSATAWPMRPSAGWRRA